MGEKHVISKIGSYSHSVFCMQLILNDPKFQPIQKCHGCDKDVYSKQP